MANFTQSNERYLHKLLFGTVALLIINCIIALIHEDM